MKSLKPSGLFRYPAAVWENPLGRLAIVTLAYWGAVKLGLIIISRPEGLAAIWPASGVALAALLLSPRRQWGPILAAIFVVNVLSNLSSGNSSAVSIGFALANTLEPALGGWLMLRLRGERITLQGLADVLALVAAAVLANAVTATLGACVPTMAYDAHYADVWLTWWIGDGLGILAVVPLAITWLRGDPLLRPGSPKRWGEIAVWLVALSGSAWYMFAMSDVNARLEPRPYMLFPVLMWASLRFSPRAAATGLALLCGIALGCTASGMGSFPLGGDTTGHRLLAVQGFFCIASITTMLLSATFSERRRAEEALHKNQALLTATGNMARVGGWEIDLASQTLTWTAEVYRIHEVGPDFQPTVEKAIDFYTPDSRPIIAKLVQRAIEYGRSFDVELQIITAKGKSVWVRAIGRAESRDGRVTKVFGAFQDINERKQADEAIQRSEQRFRALIEKSSDAITLIAADGKISYEGPTVERLTGFSSQERLGGSGMGNVYPEDLPLVRSIFASVLAEPGSSQSAQFRSVRKDGSLWWTEATATNLLAEPAVQAVVINYRDISERKQAEAEREQLLVELGRKNKELESIVYVASHDLRSPMVNIQGFGRSLQKSLGQLTGLFQATTSLEELRAAAQPILAERVPTALHFIEAASSKMDVLIDGLLRLSRVGRAALQLETVDMVNLFQNILDSMAFQVEKSGAQIAVQTPLAPCRGDKNLLNQVFSNLLDNALKYRAPDRPLVIAISSQVEAAQVVYTVADTGLGIAPENQEKVWELFRRIDDEVAPGEGLGLTIARRIVERHSGRIWVESQPGVGSRFCVGLPAQTG